MDAKVETHLEGFEEALQTWKDQRFLTREQLRCVAMFHVYLVNLSEAQGWVYDGHSFKRGTPMGCLTVRATIDSVPYVVFTSARTSLGSVVTFIRKLEAELLEWVPDRFRS